MKRVIDGNVRGDDVACRIRMPMVGFDLFGCETPFGFHGLQFAL